MTTPHHIRRVIILGHTGFLGRHLEAHFRTHTSGMDIVGRASASVDLTKLDEVRSLADLFDPETAVLMCSAIKRQVRDDLDTFSYNLRMAANVCTVLQDHPVGRFVFFSSAAVYGEDIHNTAITEETPVCPRSYYGLVKYTSECLFRQVLEGQERSSLLIVRPVVVYGPHDHGETYGPSRFIRAALRRQPIQLWGDGTERRDFVFIDDLLEATFRLTFSASEGVVNVVNGTSASFRELIELISRLVGYALDVTSRPRTKARVDHGFDNTRLTRLCGGWSLTDLEAGIRRTLDAEAQSARAEMHASEKEVPA